MRSGCNSRFIVSPLQPRLLNRVIQLNIPYYRQVPASPLIIVRSAGIRDKGIPITIGINICRIIFRILLAFHTLHVITSPISFFNILYDIHTHTKPLSYRIPILSHGCSESTSTFCKSSGALERQCTIRCKIQSATCSRSSQEWKSRSIAGIHAGIPLGYLLGESTEEDNGAGEGEGVGNGVIPSPVRRYTPRSVLLNGNWSVSSSRNVIHSTPSKIQSYLYDLSL